MIVFNSGVTYDFISNNLNAGNGTSSIQAINIGLLLEWELGMFLYAGEEGEVADAAGLPAVQGSQLLHLTCAQLEIPQRNVLQRKRFLSFKVAE